MKYTVLEAFALPDERSLAPEGREESQFAESMRRAVASLSHNYGPHAFSSLIACMIRWDYQYDATTGFMTRRWGYRERDRVQRRQDQMAHAPRGGIDVIDGRIAIEQQMFYGGPAQVVPKDRFLTTVFATAQFPHPGEAYLEEMGFFERSANRPPRTGQDGREL